MPTRRVTSKDVALAAGVSRTAVSMVMNGRADGEIDPVKQVRIREIASQLGYVPNAAAVSLQRRSTATIGLITDRIASAPFAGPLLEGATEAAMQAGYMVLTIDTSFHDQYIAGAVDTLTARNVDGLIYAAASVHAVHLPPPAKNTPLVLANATATAGGVTCFVPDNYQGQRSATRLAVEAGHRRIAYITGDNIAPATADRRRGFIDEMAAAGLNIPDGFLLAGEYRASNHHALSRQLLARTDRPTAVLCANDRGASGVVLAAAELGLQVPQDLSVIGFDDEQLFAADFPPGLTTVSLPHREMGDRAVQHLLSLLQAAASPQDPRQVTPLRCVPVIRASLGSVPRTQ